jgi:hypothetical protein
VDGAVPVAGAGVEAWATGAAAGTSVESSRVAAITAMAPMTATPATIMPMVPDFAAEWPLDWQQCLLFFPLPQGHGSLRPVFMQVPRWRTRAPSVVP